MTVKIRDATPNDCADLAVLSDAASRGLAGYFWAKAAQPGQSAFEVGRDALRNQAEHVSHFSNWQVACVGDGGVVGAVHVYSMPKVTDTPETENPIVKPLNALKRKIEGAAYVSTLALYEDARGKGIGVDLLRKAIERAADLNCQTVALMTGSFNASAWRFYLNNGFIERERQTFVPFSGSDPSGDWILLTRKV